MINRCAGLRLFVAFAVLFLLLSAGNVAANDNTYGAVDSFVEDQMARHSIPGMALAITYGDDVAYLQGYGDAGDGQAVTPQTRFYIGSISKSFTALAVMQTAEQGLVDLDAPVSQYLADFRVADTEASRTITVRHLLNQVSGLSEETYLESLSQDATLADVVADLARAEPVAAPGTAFYYFNENYTVLGRLIEVVSGQSYDEYLRGHVLGPLAMTSTLVSPEVIASANTAQGHGVLFGFSVPREQRISPSQMPYGGLVSTAEDMAHYLIAQMNGGSYAGERLLSPDGVTEMRWPNTPGAPEGEGYGMGWIIEPFGDTYVVRHGGSLENFRAFAWMLPESGYGIVVLLNQNALLPMELADSDIPAGIASLLVGSEPSVSPPMRLVYLALSAMAALVVAHDIRWWFTALPKWRRQEGPRSGIGRALPILADLILAAILYSLPYIFLRLMGRGFTWRLGLAMEPTVILLLWWGILMRVSRSVARVVVRVQTRHEQSAG